MYQITINSEGGCSQQKNDLHDDRRKQNGKFSQLGELRDDIQTTGTTRDAPSSDIDDNEEINNNRKAVHQAPKTLRSDKDNHDITNR